MRRLPFISSMCYLPLDMVDVDVFIKKLTIQVTTPPTGTDLYQSIVEEDDDGVTNVLLYDLSKPGYIGIPRSYGIDTFENMLWVDRIVAPKRDLKMFPNTIEPRDIRQERFMNNLANVCNKDYPVDILANARTGSGKTVSDLWLTAKLGVPTLVIVHTNALKNQWIGNIKKKHGIRYFYGEDWCDEYVGIAQQDICDYLGKRIVIGLLPSLVRRNYGIAFYRYFGKITIDEVHKAGAPFMSEVLKKFPAAIRIGYTATNRRDILKKVCDYHMGKPRIISSQRVAKPKVFVYPYKATVVLNSFNNYTLLTSIALLWDRNRFIANLIYNRGWLRDRNIVVFSDRVKQLQTLKDLLITDFDIPSKDVGIYAGREYTGEFRAKIKMNGKVVYSEVFNDKLKARGMANRFIRKEGIPKSSNYECTVQEVIKIIKKSVLDNVLTNCNIKLATYGIFDTGIDLPELDMGVEASPRANVDQALGRILRIKKDKVMPEWYSLHDIISDPRYEMFPPNTQKLAMFERFYKARFKSYSRQNAKVRIL